MPLTEFLHKYTLWAGRHAKEFNSKAASIKTTDSKSTSIKINVKLPFIDIYDASGSSVFYGEGAADNAAIIRNLPKALVGATNHGTRPMLKEAIDWVPGFKAKSLAETAGKRYTIFAVTVVDCKECKIQDDALAELRKLSGSLDYRVVEVRLRQ